MEKGSVSEEEEKSLLRIQRVLCIPDADVYKVRGETAC
jgi:hypothetical protein